MLFLPLLDVRKYHLRKCWYNLALVTLLPDICLVNTQIKSRLYKSGVNI
jgi:hypothetical protein